MAITFEEAHRTAARLLEQRGQLLNGHLLRVVQGNKELFREVRESLIKDGWAEDRAGIGLALSTMSVRQSQELPPSDTDTIIDAPALSPVAGGEATDWWLMAAGQTKGPFALGTLRQMQQRGEICPSDVVRRGTSGPWLQQSEVLRHASRMERSPQTTGNVDGSQPGMRGDVHQSTSALRRDDVGNTTTRSPSDLNESPSPGERPTVAQAYVPPEKLWSQDSVTRPSWLLQSWQSFAQIFGGPRRLIQFITAVCLVVAFVYWWKQPPPVGTIYREFQDCYTTLQKMRERRTGRTDWGPTVNRFRPRVEGIVTRLQFRSNQAERELYQAGHHGLIPLLAVPADPTNAERVFEKHMSAARRLIDQRGDSP